MASCPKSFKKGGKIKGYAAGGSTSYNEKTLAANNAIAGLQSQQNNSSAVPPQQTERENNNSTQPGAGPATKDTDHQRTQCRR